MKRLILLDAHAILHRAYHALPDFSTAKGEPTGALYGISTMLIKIIEDLKPDYLIACYDLKGPTYRHELYKEYKAGRAKAEDDLIAQINRSRDIFTALNIPIYDKEGFEADDIIGTIVEELKSKEDEVEVIIASGDMDTMQLIRGEKVKVYTLKKGIKDTIMYDENAVKARFGFGPELIPDYKGLRGDPSDNIPGIKGFGEKTATTLITAFGTIEHIYIELDAGHEDTFEKAGLTPRLIQLLKENREEAEFSKMLATIRRDAPINFVLPTRTFKEHIDIKKINTLWHELEFRTLTQRLEKVLGGDVEKKQQDAPGNLFTVTPDHSMTVDPVELEKTALALWVINSNTTNPQIEDIYNFADTENFVDASRKIFAELETRDLRAVYEQIELPLMPVIKKMEKQGITVRVDFLTDLSNRYHTELKDVEQRIWKEAGREFNIASPKQLGQVLFDELGLKVKNAKKTEGGARSTRESELEKMRDMHPIVPLIFEYREIAKLLSTYIDAIPPLLDTHHRLHTHYIQTGTTTGRMASVDPNLQNIPIKSELGKQIRYAFVPEQGFKLVSFDYSQIELRIAAFLSGDERMIDIFKKGEDIHTAVAAAVFKVSPHEVTHEMRRRAKVINFGIIYGMGVLALKQNLGSTRDEAQAFLNEYFATFSTLAAYLDQVKIDTAKRGYTKTFFGRRRYFEGIRSRIPYIKAAAERMAINAPIQGTEADVIKLAMINIDRYIDQQHLEHDVHLLLQVHDELVCEIRDDKVEEISNEITRIMESVMDRKDTHGITLVAEKVVGNNWGELK